MNVIDVDDLDDLVSRVQGRLDSAAAPHVTIDRLPTAVRFTSDTWRPILVSRVTDALDAELGADWDGRHFSKLG